MKKLVTLLFSMLISAGIYAQISCGDTIATDLKAENVGKKSALISWNGLSDSIYMIRYKIVSSQINYNYHYKKTVWGEEPNSYLMRNLLANTTYEVQVRSICSKNIRSEYSEPITFTTTGCSVATNLQVSNTSNNRAKLSWEGVADYYVVKYKPIVSQVFKYKRVVPAAEETAHSITLMNLQANTLYEWHVKGVCISIDTLRSFADGQSFTTTGCSAPSMISFSNITGKSADLLWDKNQFAKSYLIRYYHADSAELSVHFKKSASNTFTLKRLTPNAKYFVQIASLCYKIPVTEQGADTIMKMYSEAFSFNTNNVGIGCVPPTGLKSTPGSGTAKLSWTACPNASYYKVKFWDLKTMRFHYQNFIFNAQTTIGNLKVGTNYNWVVGAYYLDEGKMRFTGYGETAGFTTTFAKEMLTENEINIYPNPSNGVFTVSLNDGEKYDIEVYNMTGKLIYNKKGVENQSSMELNLEGNPKGIYMVKIINENNTRTNKLVIQ